MKILIVDDEPLARERLRELIRAEGGHEIFETDNGLRAVELAQSQRPDAVLLDIRMPGMDGLETAMHLSGLEPPPAVIFTTAYNDHALEAFEAHAIDYLLKPIRAERLRDALSRAGVVGRGRLAGLRGADPARRPRTHISVRGHGSLQLIPVASIRYLKADQKYVCAGWEGRESLLEESLRTLELEFGRRFLRIHRNCLVALEFVESMEQRADGLFQLRLRSVATPLAVSRRHAAGVRKAIRAAGSRK
jgi:two-component system response regulator AlgR